MTRRSKREIEHALGDLGSADTSTVQGWVNSHLDTALTEGWDTEYTVLDADGNVIESPGHGGQVCIAKTSGPAAAEFWVDETDVPEWIDVEADLPVRA